ncbi:alpha/beta hydrolase [Actinoplanes sp. NPDC000266]
MSPSPQYQTRRSAGRRFPGWLSAVLVLAALLVAAPQAAVADPWPRPAKPGCAARTAEVGLTGHRDARQYRIRGWLCQPRQPTGTVQLLVPGLTYAHTYWTGPEGPDSGYVRTALTTGTAVFVFDRVGTGGSGTPPAEQVTLDAEATVIHQLVSALRDGELGRFTRVVGVGHSYGSMILQAETAAFQDLDQLVLTGLLHELNWTTEAAFAANLHPAGADPAYAHAGLPDGYLTTQPGTRAEYFLNPATAIPGAAAWDERTKATATSGELALDLGRQAADSRQIRVPVLLVVGADDVIFCGPGLACATANDLCARERGFYPADTVLDAAVIAGTGHSIALHRTAEAAAAAITSWITGHPYAATPAITRCTS